MFYIHVVSYRTYVSAGKNSTNNTDIFATLSNDCTISVKILKNKNNIVNANFSLHLKEPNLCIYTHSQYNSFALINVGHHNGST